MKKNWLFWLPVGAAAIWAGTHFLPGFGHEAVFGHGHGGHGMMHGGHGGRHGFGWITAVVWAGLALFGARWLLKKGGSSKEEEFIAIPYTAPVESSNAAKLDAWEQTISKEDK